MNKVVGYTLSEAKEALEIQKVYVQFLEANEKLINIKYEYINYNYEKRKEYITSPIDKLIMSSKNDLLTELKRLALHQKQRSLGNTWPLWKGEAYKYAKIMFNLYHWMLEKGINFKVDKHLNSNTMEDVNNPQLEEGSPCLEVTQNEVIDIYYLKDYIYNRFDIDASLHRYHIHNVNKDSFELCRIIRLMGRDSGFVSVKEASICFCEDRIELVCGNDVTHTFNITPEGFINSRFDSQVGIEILFDLIDK